MTEEDIKGLKSEANSLFRCGNYLGAATTFQRALDTIDQVSSTDAVEAAKYADLELACLSNLSLAWIKLGSMAKAEEACCRALLRWPSSTKALFRRGQARLALGRPTEAATDFREVSVQEPTNTEATKMLHRALEEAVRPVSPRVGLEAPQRLGVHDGGGLTSSPSLAGTTGGGEAFTKDKKHVESNTTTAVDEETTTLPCALLLADNGREENERRITTVLPHHVESSPPASGRVLNASEAADNHSRPEDSIPTDTPGVSSFMVSDWLHSAAREQAEQKVIMDKRKPIFTDDPQQDVSSSIESCDGAAAVIDASGDASVSELVSQLKARKASKQKKKSPRAATRTPEEESEWSRLKAEELGNVQVCRRRYEGSQAGMLAKAASKRGTLHPGGNACAKKGGEPSSRDAARGNGVAMQTSQWASLEEEEKQVRDAFRAKLCIGNNKSVKKKKKKNAVSRMRADVPP